MNRIVLVLVVLVIAFVGVGLYRGWFSSDMTTSDHKTNFNLSVDRDKIKVDVNGLKK